jgi:hypothetical protein
VKAVYVILYNLIDERFTADLHKFISDKPRLLRCFHCLAILSVLDIKTSGASQIGACGFLYQCCTGSRG